MRVLIYLVLFFMVESTGLGSVNKRTFFSSGSIPCDIKAS